MLPEKIQRNRKLFLRKLTEWIAELRNRGRDLVILLIDIKSLLFCLSELA